MVSRKKHVETCGTCDYQCNDKIREAPEDAPCRCWEEKELPEPGDLTEACPFWEEAEESCICGSCSGSGEGMYDGAICHSCHGSGERLTEYGLALHEAAEDDEANRRYELRKDREMFGT